MAQFSTTHQPASKGRPKGSRNIRSMISKEMSDKALKKLDDALSKGEPWAIQEVVKRTYPTLKPVTPTDSIDGDYIKAKMFELVEMKQRLEALEDQNNG